MRTRTVLPTLCAITAALLLAACGGGGGDDGVASLGASGGDDDSTTETTLSEEEAEEQTLEWAACMRENGIDVPDPEVDENGNTRIAINIGGGADDDDEGDGADAPDPADFDAAREECGDPPRMGGNFSEEDREEMEENALAFAECMRENGVPDFPDPDFSGEGPGAGPMTRAERADGDDDGQSEVIAGPFGVVELDDPEVRAAFEACRELSGMPDDGPGMAVPSGASAKADS